jgi:hypothetical protein
MKTHIRIINPIAKAMNEGRRREYAPKIIPDKTKYNRKKSKQVAHATFSNNINKERN